MPYIEPEVIEAVKRIDLLTYLKNNEPKELIYDSTNCYKTRTHDSLKISNGLWHWWSKNIGGRSALDYLIKVRGYSFLEAVKLLSDSMPYIPEVSATTKGNKTSKKLLLPASNEDAERVIRYLKTRGIEQSIIEYCLVQDILYESKEHHNAVFIGKDEKGCPKYAAIHGTGKKDYKREATGSNKKYAFFIPADMPNMNIVHVFESPIDLLSYATLEMLKGNDWKAEHMQSLAGVYRPRKGKEQRTPIALKRCLQDYPEISTVVTHLDNDLAGRDATKMVKDSLPDKRIIDVPPKKGKDINDMLCLHLGIPIQSYEDRKRDRNKDRNEETR